MKVAFDLLVSVSAHDIRNKKLIDITLLPGSDFRRKLDDSHQSHDPEITFEFRFGDCGIL